MSLSMLTFLELCGLNFTLVYILLNLAATAQGIRCILFSLHSNFRILFTGLYATLVQKPKSLNNHALYAVCSATSLAVDSTPTPNHTFDHRNH